jgi:predicted nucleic acid-binding protein
MRPQPDANVLAWLKEQAAETLYISTVTLAESLFGITALQDGKRKTLLARTLDGVMELIEIVSYRSTRKPPATTPSSLG